MADFIYAGDGGIFNTCTKCGETKPIHLFSKEKRYGIGYACKCKACVCEAVKTYAKNNPEKVRARHKRENMSHEEYEAWTKERSAYYRKNPAYAEKARKRARLYYDNNREKVLARMSSDAGREYSRTKMREKLKDDSNRLHSNVSRAIRASIKDKIGRSWESLAGYTLTDLIRHLERQFLPGMTWKNHGRGRGKWHIDHIVPRVSFKFDSADDPDFKACWALTNLRPLWSEQNISKHGKRIYLI